MTPRYSRSGSASGFEAHPDEAAPGVAAHGPQREPLGRQALRKALRIGGAQQRAVEAVLPAVEARR